MNRWKITRAQAPTSSGKIWQVWEGDQRRKMLITWAEAMDYANRRARTVEVTLPRLTALPTGRHIVSRNGLIIEYQPSSSHPNLPAGHIAVEPEERRPLAAALLAIAHKKEQS